MMTSDCFFPQNMVIFAQVFLKTTVCTLCTRLFFWLPWWENLHPKINIGSFLFWCVIHIIVASCYLIELLKLQWSHLEIFQALVLVYRCYVQQDEHPSKSGDGWWWKIAIQHWICELLLNKFTSPIFAHLLCLKVVAAWLTSNIFLTWFSDLLQGNIQRLTVQQLDAYKAHSWLLSPPCQPYTRQGFHIFSLFWQFLNSNDLLLLPDTWGFMLLESHDKAVDVVLIFFALLY